MKQQNGWQGDAQQAKEKMSEVLSLNDEQLRAAIRAAAMAGGMNERRAQALSRDPDAIRRRLASVKPEDLQKMLSQISPEQMEALAEQVRQMRQGDQ